MTQGSSQSAAEIALLIADVLEAAGAVRHVGDLLAAELGQTQARWQVLSVLSEGRLTVPQAARRLGIQRQSVQRVVDLLAAESLVRPEPNPDHRRSPIVVLTPSGREVLCALTAAARPWHSEAARDMSPGDLATARRVLHTLIKHTRSAKL